jgi:hypothetical protein
MSGNDPFVKRGHIGEKLRPRTVHTTEEIAAALAERRVSGQAVSQVIEFPAPVTREAEAAKFNSAEEQAV